MIRRGTDVSVVGAQSVAWILVVLLGEIDLVFTVLYLQVTAGIGISIVIFSVIQLGSRSYSPSTRPSTSNVFVQRGIYRYVRHPLYSGLLIVGLAFFLSQPTLIGGSAFLVLVLVTNVRASLEEEMLEDRHSDYAEYTARTKRFIPLVI